MRVRKDLVVYGDAYFIEEMEKYLGMTVTINSNLFDESTYCINEDNRNFCWSIEMFEDIIKTPLSEEDIKHILNTSDSFIELIGRA